MKNDRPTIRNSRRTKQTCTENSTVYYIVLLKTLSMCHSYLGQRPTSLRQFHGNVATLAARLKFVHIYIQTSKGLLFDVRYFDISHLSKRSSDPQTKWSQEKNNFLAHFSIPFHMVCSVLLRVLASKTIE